MKWQVITIACLAALMFPLNSGAQSLLDGAESVAFDSLSGLYLVSSYRTSDIVAIDSIGQQDYWYENIGGCAGNHIDGGRLYVSLNDGAVRRVVGVDLITKKIVWSAPVSPINNVDGLTTDTSGFLYAVDTGGRIFKINIADSSVSVWVSSGLTPFIQDITFDKENNRLLSAGYISQAPIQAISLPDGIVTNAVITPDGLFDGIYCDPDGFVYTASHAGGVIRKYENTFTEVPEVLSTGHDDPTGLCYNHIGYVLAVPNFESASVDLIPFWGKPQMRNYDFSDDMWGNGNGWIEAGETIQMTIELENTHPVAIYSFSAILTCNNPAISIDQNLLELVDILPGDTVTSDVHPFEFSIPGDLDDTTLTFSLEMFWESDYGTKAVTETIEKGMGRVPVLLVDGSGENNVTSYYYESAKSCDVICDVRIASNCYPPPVTVLKMYDAVIWFTGDNRPDLICAEDIAVLQEYLDAGGQLFLTGQGIAQQLSTLDPVFSQNYLHAEYQTSITPTNLMIAQPGCQVLELSDSLNIVGEGGAANQTSVDRMENVNGGVAECNYYGSPLAAAISYAGDYRVVFFGFGFEAITVGVPDRTDRDTVIARVLDFFQWPNPHLCCVVRGDMDRNGELNISDLTYYVDYLFAGGPSPVCPVEGDADGNGEMNISDLTYYVDYLFGGGLAPPSC